jgi:predicted amidohydrolase
VSLAIALVSDVFFGDGAHERLVETLTEARERGAVLAVLPELPLDPWIPAAREIREGDAEDDGGPRLRRLAAAARESGIAVLGGMILRGPARARFNTAVFVDTDGQRVGVTAKAHVPQEPGFWERDHYRDAHAPAKPFAWHDMRFGVQICSDLNRPVATHALAALGAQVILHPRATEPDTFDKWRLVMQATAMTASVWILSVNRPRPEGGTPLGGPSCVVAPDGEVMLETTERIAIAHVDVAACARARTDYPGYLPLRTDLYARALAEADPWPSAFDP